MEIGNFLSICRYVCEIGKIHVKIQICLVNLYFPCQNAHMFNGLPAPPNQNRHFHVKSQIFVFVGFWLRFEVAMSHCRALPFAVKVCIRSGSYIVLSFCSQSLHQVGPEDDSAGSGLPLLVFRRPGLRSMGI